MPEKNLNLYLNLYISIGIVATELSIGIDAPYNVHVRSTYVGILPVKNFYTTFSFLVLVLLIR